MSEAEESRRIKRGLMVGALAGLASGEFLRMRFGIELDAMSVASNIVGMGGGGLLGIVVDHALGSCAAAKKVSEQPQSDVPSVAPPLY